MTGTGGHKESTCTCCVCKNKRHVSKSAEHKRKIGLGNKGKVRTAEMKATYRRVNKTHLLWQDPEYRKKQLKSLKKMLSRKKVLPNKPETFLIELLQKLFPDQWKYVGDFKQWINGKNPDFIHVEQKKIIEMFGDYWHGERKIGISNEQHEQERINVFAKEGYETLIIWEHELNHLVKKIMRFSK